MAKLEFIIIEAPSALGLFPEGVERLSEALLEAGLAKGLGARHGGRVEPPQYDPRRDQETLILNPRGIADYSVALADRVEAVVGSGGFPVVLGGDCSILLGNLLALRRRGRFGLLFLDGHADFYQPEAARRDDREGIFASSRRRAGVIECLVKTSPCFWTATLMQNRSASRHGS